MKQVLQDLNTGETILEDVPVPSLTDAHVLIKTTRTLVSVGTERMLVEFGKGNMLQKARQQPDKVRQAIQKVGTDGLVPTIKAIKNKLDQPIALGYCNVGRVVESSDPSFAVGDRVASNGHHAEVVLVPRNLCARIPDRVDDDSAAFTVISAIALQGIRLVNPSLGETVVVTGLGLIGLVAVQLLRAHGCRVIGIDYDPSKLEIAKGFGAETINLSDGQDPVEIARQYSRNRGVDAVLITASTDSNQPIHQAANMCRKRGRIVLVGVVGMEFSRADFYEKELSFQVSCSYGPGRYDADYEEKGHDYPIGYVRWTEQRNFEAVLDLMADGRLDMKALISHRFAIAEASKAYGTLIRQNPLGVLLEYDSSDAAGTQTIRNVSVASPVAGDTKAVVGFVGAGAYATSVLVDAFSQTNARLKAISSVTGVSAVHAARKFSIEQATTDTQALLRDTDVNTLVIATRHDSHATWVMEGLRHGKHVFVEKPLVLTRQELVELTTLYDGLEERPILMVGFNRRYSPHVRRMKALLASKKQPMSLSMTVNAGMIPAVHWTQDRSIGGGRIIGECCHFIDLLRFLAGHSITRASARAMDSECNDTVSIQLAFADGSIGTINYLANGSKAIPKERLEVFCGGSVLQLDNFRMLKGFGWRGFKRERLWTQDKGQVTCVQRFVEAIETGNVSELIPMDELVEVAQVCFDIDEQTYL